MSLDIFPFHVIIVFNTRAVPLPDSGDVHKGRVFLCSAGGFR